jgi:DNA-binding CsgD family transcriptional regulator
MSFYQILLDALGNGVGLCAVLFGFLVAARTKSRLMKLFNWFLVSVWITNFSFILYEFLNISKATVGPAAYYFLVYSFLLIYSSGVYMIGLAYLFLIAGASATRVPRPYIVILSVIYLSRFTIDALGISWEAGWHKNDILHGISDSFFLLMSLSVAIMSVVYFRRLRKGPLRSFFIAFFVIIIIEFLIEIFVLSVPNSFWLNFGVSPEFLGMSVMIMFIFLVAFRFLLQGYRATDSVQPVRGVNPEDIYAKFGLSNREKEVLVLVREGISNKEIAARLFISLATAKSHVHNILEKTECPTRASLIAFFSAAFLEKTQNQSKD